MAGEMIEPMQARYCVSKRRACEAIPANSAPIRYKSRRLDQASLKMRIPVFSE